MKWLLLLVLLMAAPLSADSLVCIHGFLAPKLVMHPLCHSLRHQMQTVNWDYPSRAKTIEGHAQDLLATLNTIAENNPGQPIHFVTHSMGGLILRVALNSPDCPKEALLGRAVLIAPPNGGSKLARALSRVQLGRKFLGPHAGWQLAYPPLFGDMPAEMPVLVIAGTCGFNPVLPFPNDGKVALTETALSTPYHQERVFAGHSWISFTPSTIRKAKRFLLQSAEA